MTTSTANSTTFITGATGFVGSHLVRRYVRAGHNVVALRRPGSDLSLLADVVDQVTWADGDVTDIPSLEAAIKPGSDVIHAAAVVSYAPRDRDRMEKVNVEGTANVVNVCLQAGVRRLGFVSSIAALGRPATPSRPDRPITINEAQRWEDSPYNSFYGQTKYRAELEVWRGVAEGLAAVIVNPALVLGEGDWTKTSVQVLKYGYDEKTFYPTGLVSYVDVLDVVDMLYALMQSPRPDVVNHRYVLSAGTIPYQTLFREIAAAFGKRPPSRRVPPALTQVLWRLEAVRAWFTGKTPLITRETARSSSSHYRFDGSRITQVLGGPYRPLQETLRRAAEALIRPTVPNSKF